MEHSGERDGIRICVQHIPPGYFFLPSVLRLRSFPSFCNFLSYFHDLYPDNTFPFAIAAIKSIWIQNTFFNLLKTSLMFKMAFMINYVFIGISRRQYCNMTLVYLRRHALCKHVSKLFVSQCMMVWSFLCSLMFDILSLSRFMLHLCDRSFHQSLRCLLQPLKDFLFTPSL